MLVVLGIKCYLKCGINTSWLVLLTRNKYTENKSGLRNEKLQQLEVWEVLSQFYCDHLLCDCTLKLHHQCLLAWTVVLFSSRLLKIKRIMKQAIKYARNLPIFWFIEINNSKKVKQMIDKPNKYIKRIWTNNFNPN